MASLKTRVVDWKSLSPAEIERLLDEVFPVFEAVFANYDRAGVAKGLTADVYTISRMQLILDESGRCVGFSMFRVHETEFRGEPIAVVRVALAVERMHRGGAPFGAFLASELLKYRVANPRRGIYGFDLVVHPTSYITLTRLLGDCWPHWERETPPEIVELATRLADLFGGKRIEGTHPLVRGVPVYTQDTEVERAYWQQSERPEVRYFLRINPDYAVGRAVAAVFPLNVGDVLEGLARLGWRSLERQFEAAEAALQPFGLYTAVEAFDAPDLLRRSSVFRDLPEEALQRLVARAERRSVPAGRVLFRQGDAADALYVVRDGQAFVLLDVGAEEPVVVDQIGPGEVFGEIALLLPQPRSATVRAVQSLDLLRIARDQVEDLLREEPVIADALWRAVARRALRSHLVGSPRFADLSRARREEWLGRIGHRQLGRGAELDVTQGGWVYVVDGAVEVSSGDAWMDLGHRSLAPVRQGDRVVARADSHVALLPADGRIPGAGAPAGSTESGLKPP